MKAILTLLLVTILPNTGLSAENPKLKVTPKHDFYHITWNVQVRDDAKDIPNDLFLKKGTIISISANGGYGTEDSSIYYVEIVTSELAGNYEKTLGEEPESIAGASSNKAYSFRFDSRKEGLAFLMKLMEHEKPSVKKP